MTTDDAKLIESVALEALNAERRIRQKPTLDSFDGVHIEERQFYEAVAQAALRAVREHSSDEVEHYENCECCQNFARMEKRYDHLRGCPQDDEQFTHQVAVKSGVDR